jgi:hypothetical protein
MNYKINATPTNSFEVVETNTEQVVKTFMALKDAKKFMRSLNLGGGFDGWTPTFFLKILNLNKSVV